MKFYLFVLKTKEIIFDPDELIIFFKILAQLLQIVHSYFYKRERERERDVFDRTALCEGSFTLSLKILSTVT